MSTPNIPTPDDVRNARLAAELSQQQACELVYLGDRGRWAEYERGKHTMDAARWELFLIKCGMHPDYAKAQRGRTTMAARPA